MWEIAVVVGLSFIPLYLEKTAEKIKSPLYHIIVYFAGFGFVAYLLWVAKQIADINSAVVASSLERVFIGYVAVVAILVVIFIGNLIDSERKGKRG